MKLRDPRLLADYMAVRDLNQSQLARRAGCSRQFVWQLIHDRATQTCTDEMAERIEEALSVLPGTIFRHSSAVRPDGGIWRSPDLSPTTTREPPNPRRKA